MADSLAPAGPEEIAFAFLLWRVFIYFHPPEWLNEGSGAKQVNDLSHKETNACSSLVTPSSPLGRGVKLEAILLVGARTVVKESQEITLGIYAASLAS